MNAATDISLHLQGANNVFHTAFLCPYLRIEGLVVGDEGGELAGLVQAGTEETRNLLDDGLRSEEGVVFLSQLLHQLLVLVHLLQVVHVL